MAYRALYEKTTFHKYLINLILDYRYDEEYCENFKNEVRDKYQKCMTELMYPNVFFEVFKFKPEMLPQLFKKNRKLRYIKRINEYIKLNLVNQKILLMIYNYDNNSLFNRIMDLMMNTQISLNDIVLNIGCNRKFHFEPLTEDDFKDIWNNVSILLDKQSRDLPRHLPRHLPKRRNVNLTF